MCCRERRERAARRISNVHKEVGVGNGLSLLPQPVWLTGGDIRGVYDIKGDRIVVAVEVGNCDKVEGIGVIYVRMIFLLEWVASSAQRYPISQRGGGMSIV